MPVTVKNAARVAKKIGAIPARAELFVARALLAQAKRVQTGMRKALGTAKSGRIYPVKRKWPKVHNQLSTRSGKRAYQASWRGQPMASPTGNVWRAVVVKSHGFDLRRGKSTTVRKITGGPISVTVGVHAPRLLEIVNRLESQKQRPTLSPVWRKLRASIQLRIRRSVEKDLNAELVKGLATIGKFNA